MKLRVKQSTAKRFLAAVAVLSVLVPNAASTGGTCGASVVASCGDLCEAQLGQTFNCCSTPRNGTQVIYGDCCAYTCINYTCVDLATGLYVCSTGTQKTFIARHNDQFCWSDSDGRCHDDPE